MSLVVKLIMDGFFTEIHGYHIISNRRNDFSFVEYYFILVHNKTILKTINMQTVIYEMCYIVEYLILNIFSFLIFLLGKIQDDNNIYTSCVNSTET